MKRLFCIWFILGLLPGFISCNGNERVTDQPLTGHPDHEAENDDADNSGLADGNILVVYYSYTNNTHTIVTDLLTQIEADVVRVEPAEKGLNYAANNYAIGSEQIAAIRKNPDNAAFYPAIDPIDISWEDYHTVIVAAPLWWSSMAAPLQTFLFNHGPEMAGKNIGLIVSSASTGISGVEADAKRLVPKGKFLTPSLWIRSSQTAGCHSLIAEWLKNCNIAD